VRWLQMQSPAELMTASTRHLLTGETLVDSTPVTPDMRDPRNRNVARFDSAAMDLKRLAGGPTSVRQRVASMRRHSSPTAASE